MKCEPNWDYCRLDGEQRAKMIATMINNSEATAAAAEAAEVEAENVASGLWALDHAAGEVCQNPPSEFEGRILHGAWVVTPILVAFSIELALKAMIAQEATNPWLKTHNLLRLYRQLTEEQHSEIERVPMKPTHSNFKGESVLGLGGFKGVEATLREHRNLFVEWRYRYEDMLTGRQSNDYSISELQIVQWKIIGAARKRQTSGC